MQVPPETLSPEEVADEMRRAERSLDYIDNPTQKDIDADYEFTGDYEIQADELKQMNDWNKANREPQSEPPETLSPEEVNAHILANQPAPSEDENGEMPPEVLTAQQVKDIQAIDDYSGRQVAELMNQFGPGEVTMAGAANTIQAAQKYWDRKTGWFDKALYTLTIPEQAVARQAVNVLENLKGLTSEEAKNLLSRDQVHGSDIVNVMWRNQFGQPDTWFEKAARFTTGLAADILIDPLSYLGVGVLTQAGKTAVVGGRTVKGLDKVSKLERHYVKTLSKLEQVVTKTGNVIDATGDASDAILRNKQMVQSALDGRVGFDDLLKPMNLTPEAMQEANQIVRSGMTEKSLSRQWMEGERGLTARIGIPFTRFFVETDIPVLGRGIGAISYGLIEKLGVPAVNLARTPIMANVMGKERNLNLFDSSVRIAKDLASRTGALLFDQQQAVRLSSREVVKRELGMFETEARRVLGRKEKALGEDGFGQLLQDMVDELDNGLYTQQEAIQMAKDRGVEVFQRGPVKGEVYGSGLGDEFLQDGGRPVVGYDEGLGLFNEVKINPLVERLYTASPQDAARMERLSRHPEVLEMIGDMRIKMQDMVAEYQKRGIPMAELNPFGQGWARRYVKHMVSTNFVDKMKEIGKAENAFGEALTLMENTIGGVDRSALGRKYRGTIQAANAASMEKLGVKQFVDEPLELFSARIQEMNKVIQDYDLLAAAEKYAVVGQNPGVGWIQYNPDNFKKLVLDVSADKAEQWKLMMPKIFANAGEVPVYLPEEVYDKMAFWINGWNIPSVAIPFATSLHFLDRVFRNNALFGTGYLGQNAFSNALTYLMHSDYRAPMAMVDAMSMFLPGAATRKVMVKQGDKAISLTGEQLLKEAIEDGVLRTSLAKEIEFSDLAEYVASNREARQAGAWKKAANLADVVMLYRLNRNVARVSDELPKLAQYIQRRQMGFTRKGAAESAEQLFYNFGIVSRSQAVVRRVVPFSSFAIKTIESVTERLTQGGINRLAIPGKVNAVFDGAFVQDPETRKALDESLPWYKKTAMHPVHGPLLPGQREVLAELPWAQATITQLFSENAAVHPIFQLFGLKLSQKLATDEFGNMDKSSFWRSLQGVADLYIPPPINNALAVAEITGALDASGFFMEKYLPVMRASLDESGNYKLDETTEMQIETAADFGKAMASRYGKDWLFKSFFDIPMTEGNEDSLGVAIQYAARGEFIRKKFRQLALGTASMTKLDVNYAMNRKAIERKIQRTKNDMARDLNELGILVDIGRVSEAEADKRTEPIDPREFEIQALEFKLEALDDYYGFILEAEEKIKESGAFPGVGTLDIFEFLLGGKEYDYTKDGAVEEEDVIGGLTQFDLLSPQKTKEVLQKEAKEEGENVAD